MLELYELCWGTALLCMALCKGMVELCKLFVSGVEWCTNQVVYLIDSYSHTEK